MKPRLALIILAALPLAASCGLSKPLDRPPPLFGKDKAKYEAELARQRAEKDAAKHHQPPGGNVPTPPPPDVPIPSGPLAPPPAP